MNPVSHCRLINGQPYRCTCPSCHHGGGDGVEQGFKVCKHMRAVERLTIGMMEAVPPSWAVTGEEWREILEEEHA